MLCCVKQVTFFLHVASFINLVHALIIVHFLCGMHHNMDSQIEHKPAGMIRAHVQLNIDKKNTGQTNESSQSNTSDKWNAAATVHLHELMNERKSVVKNTTKCLQ